MIFLLITYDIDHLVDGMLVEAHLRSTNVLSDVDRGAIRAKQDLAVEPFVREVCPYRAIGILDELTFFQATQYLSLAEEVSL